MNMFKCGAIVALVSITTLSSNAAVEKPIIMDEAMLSVTVSDFHGFIDGAGGIASQIQPMMSGPMLKSLIGMQVNDAGLAGIPAGSGLSVVAMDPTNIFAVIEVTEALAPNYITAAQAQGIQAAYTNGALIVAASPEVLAKGAEKCGAVKSALLTKRSPALRIAMQPAQMMARNKDAIDGFMAMLPMLMGQSMMQQPGATLDSTQSMIKILEGELLVLLSLSEQCEAAEVVLAPENGGLKVSETFVPKAGTALATLVNAPVQSKPDPKLHAGLLGDATILVDMHYANSGALADFVVVEAGKLIKELKLEDVDAAGLANTMKKWISLYGGTGCEAVRFGSEGDFQVRYVMGVKDEAATLAALKTMSTDMAPFLKMYESMDLPMELEFNENVREADGVAIHQFAVKMDYSSMPADQQEGMKEMGLDNMVYDLAISDGKVFYTEPGKVEELMKTVKAGGEAAPIQARSAYPAGGFYYFDLDVGSYMAFVASMMPASPETAMMKQQMGDLFKGVPPVTSAGFKQDGCVEWGFSIPGELLAKYGHMIMMSSMQQQGMGGPTTAPVQ